MILNFISFLLRKRKYLEKKIRFCYFEPYDCDGKTGIFGTSLDCGRRRKLTEFSFLVGITTDALARRDR